MKPYLVKREHIGDKAYRTGDTREADPAMVRHLVKSGVLVEAKAANEGSTKAAPEPQNKAAPKLQNKSGQ